MLKKDKKEDTIPICKKEKEKWGGWFFKKMKKKISYEAMKKVNAEKYFNPNFFAELKKG